MANFEKGINGEIGIVGTSKNFLNLIDDTKKIDLDLQNSKRKLLFIGSSNNIVNLSENASNFTSLEITYHNNLINKSIIISPSGKWELLISNMGKFNGFFALRLAHGEITVSGNKIEISPIGNNYTADLRFNGTIALSDATTTFYVTRVVGYK